jgi:hypothetical protein
MILLVEQCYPIGNTYYFVTDTGNDKCTFRCRTIDAAIQNAYRNQYASPKNFSDIKAEIAKWKLTSYDITDIIASEENFESVYVKYPEILL